ncbi:MAG: aminotransferase class I/II-fold pyridoxal phosphate-dependent enzyme [Cryomorphaceae bacterium]|nr:aminotransferase class I/II-fold pyridoxal phosphate-dependent enzyme [Cryomorphaceae bacterium]
MKNSTLLIHAVPVDAATGSISVPIHQTSTFVQDAPGVNKGFDYSRSNNPTRKVLEDLLAQLEGGAGGFAFSSGLAAVDAVVKLLSSGDEVVAVDDIYGGTFRLYAGVYEKFGVKITFVDTSKPEKVAEAITERTKFIWLETPTNPTLKISDIALLADIAHAHDALLVVDNTFASPIGQQPIALGADIVIHSATKYLAGHSDVIAGAVIAKDPEVAARIKYIQNATGAVLGPFDCWLTIRGIETLELRLQRQSENALAVAQWLEGREEVERVHFPGLSSHPNHAIAAKQQAYFGGVVSFVIRNGNTDDATDFVTSTKLFKLAESLGGVKSLLCHPATMTHKSTPRDVREAAGVVDGLIRLSCGIENGDDLIDDLDQAFVRQRKKVTNPANINWK